VAFPVTVAVMGCVVNGPGEAANADVAVCAGKDNAVLYVEGRQKRTVPANDIAAAVLSEVEALGLRRSGEGQAE
jgi:(E)-4-hydroxy-3-methylbut-2-enyl-diphosphate synthase